MPVHRYMWDLAISTHTCSGVDLSDRPKWREYSLCLSSEGYQRSSQQAVGTFGHHRAKKQSEN